jgi:GT2 family glycosyltransferase
LDSPLVTVVTPCYNSAAWVVETIASVRRQTLSRVEHVLVDDGSTDDSYATIARAIAGNPRATLIRQANRGVSAARNAGARAASSESRYLLFLDADDTLDRHALERLSAYLDCRPDVGLAFCRCRYIDAAGKVMDDRGFIRNWQNRRVPSGLFGQRVLAEKEPETPFESLFQLPGTIPSVMMFRRSVYATTPGWDPELRGGAEDGDIVFQMGLRAPVHFLSEELVGYRQHPQQASASAAKLRAEHARLFAKWKTLDGLEPRASCVVRRAVRFREAVLVPSYWLKDAGESFCRRRFLAATRSCARAAKSMLRYGVTFTSWEARKVARAVRHGFESAAR